MKRILFVTTYCCASLLFGSEKITSSVSSGANEELTQMAIKFINESNDNNELLKRLKQFGIDNFEKSNMLVREIVSPRVLSTTSKQKEEFIQFLLRNEEFHTVKRFLLNRLYVLQDANARIYQRYIENFPHNKSICTLLKDDYDLNPNMILYQCIARKEYDKAKIYIESSNVPELIKKEMGYDSNTILHWSVYFNDIEATKQIVELGGFHEKKNKDGHTPLGLAETKACPDIIKLLEEYKATHQSSLQTSDQALLNAGKQG